MTREDAPPDIPSPQRSTAGGMLHPGIWVRHLACPEWGIGQVQSAAGTRITVNFEHAGKVLIDARHVALEAIDR